MRASTSVWICNTLQYEGTDVFMKLLWCIGVPISAVFLLRGDSTNWGLASVFMEDQ